MCLARLLFKSLILDDYDSTSHSALLLCLNLVLKVAFLLELGITQVPTLSKRSVLALTLPALNLIPGTCVSYLFWLKEATGCAPLVEFQPCFNPKCGTFTNRSFGKDGPLWSGPGPSTPEDWPQATPPGLG